MQRWNLVLALALATVSPARSQGPVEPEWKKASGGFGAVLLVTNDAAGLFAGSRGSSLTDYLSRIRTTSKVPRGKAVVAVVIFYGCAADHTGNCRSDMDLRLRYPDGSLYGEWFGPELWYGRPPADGVWEASAESLGFMVEPEDPLGTYTFEAVVRDRAGSRTLRLTQTVEVVPSSP